MRYKIGQDGSVRIWLSADNTYNWARRSGRAWPCSTLSGRAVFAEFDRHGDLVDVSPEIADVHEFNALTGDYIGEIARGFLARRVGEGRYRLTAAQVRKLTGRAELPDPNTQTAIAWQEFGGTLTGARTWSGNKRYWLLSIQK